MVIRKRHDGKLARSSGGRPDIYLLYVDVLDQQAWLPAPRRTRPASTPAAPPGAPGGRPGSTRCTTSSSPTTPQRPPSRAAGTPGMASGSPTRREHARLIGLRARGRRRHRRAGVRRVPAPRLVALHRLLRATASRPANFGCFWDARVGDGLPTARGQVRHAAWPPAPGASGDRRRRGVPPHRLLPLRRLPVLHPGRPVAATRCPHRARPGLTSNSRPASTPAWTLQRTFRLSPMVASELVADCFELAGHPGARHARVAVRPADPGSGAGACRDGCREPGGRYAEGAAACSPGGPPPVAAGRW